MSSPKWFNDPVWFAKVNNWLLPVCAFILIGLGVWSGFTQSQATSASNRATAASDRANDAADKAKAAAANALRAIREIQESRIENTWLSCFSGDRKSVDARSAVEGLVAGAPTTAEGQQGAAQFRTITVTLLSSFLPYNDCAAQLRQRFHRSYPATIPNARRDWLALQRERAKQSTP